MATGIFGFEAYPQRKSLDPQKVGMLLRQRAQPPEQAPAQGMQKAQIPSSLTEGEGDAGGPVPEDQHQQLRAIGALLAGTGQPQDRPLEEHSETATNAAIASALTRIGNGGNAGRLNTVKPMASHVGRLRALGMSEAEVELLSRSRAI